MANTFLWFGLYYLPTDKIEECHSFVELIVGAPSDDKCMKFADYILEFYIIDGNSSNLIKNQSLICRVGDLTKPALRSHVSDLVGVSFSTYMSLPRS